MTITRRFTIGLAAVASVAVVHAQDATKHLVLDLNYDDVKPDVQVKEYDNRSVEEYRVNNQLYALKVRPKNGEPYYLVDPNGSGRMEWRRDTTENIRVPNWSLLKW